MLIPDDSDLLVGGQIGTHLVDRQSSDDGIGDRRPIARRQHDPLNSGKAQAFEQLLRSRPQFVGQHKTTRNPAIDRDCVVPGQPSYRAGGFTSKQGG